MSGRRVDAKVVLLGQEGVGKSSLVERCAHRRFRPGPYQNTIGAAFVAKVMSVGEQTVTLGIWDTAGSERYEAMSRIYYRGARAAIVCYDLTDSSSFQRAKFWVNELQNCEEVGGRGRDGTEPGRGVGGCGTLPEGTGSREPPSSRRSARRRAAGSTCAAPRATCWRRTGGSGGWTSTTCRTTPRVRTGSSGEGGGQEPGGGAGGAPRPVRHGALPGPSPPGTACPDSGPAGTGVPPAPLSPAVPRGDSWGSGVLPVPTGGCRFRDQG
uniref:RAB24, member RAS oncogene family n=1 Tax=Calidris pygmaea TaxID=425635 RepID=A0A8C3KAK9_9CHAR